MEANPYSTPAANLYGAASGGDVVSPGTIAQLAGTRPWARFMSIVLWLSLFPTLLMSLATLLADPSELRGNTDASYEVFVGMGVFSGLAGFLVVYPALKLWKFANCVGRLMASHSVADLDAALAEQRRYWKFSGILIILGVCLGVIVFVGMLAFGFAMLKAAGIPL